MTAKLAIIGCGYVGSAIASHWRDRGYELTVTITTPAKVPQLRDLAGRVVLLAGDDLKGMTEVIGGQEAIVLCVAPNRRQASPNPYATTYLTTARTLVKALENVPEVRQVIYTSSHSVLGDRGGNWVTEATPPSPVTENAKILAETERVLLTAAPKLRVCILRLTGIYGPGRELVKIYRSWFGSERPGDGGEYTHWIHLDDIVAGIDFAYQNQLEGTYHLVNDRSITKRELLERLAQNYGLDEVIWDRNSPFRPNQNLRLSNRKLKDCGFQLLHPDFVFDCKLSGSAAPPRA